MQDESLGLTLETPGITACMLGRPGGLLVVELLLNAADVGLLLVAQFARGAEATRLHGPLELAVGRAVHRVLALDDIALLVVHDVGRCLAEHLVLGVLLRADAHREVLVGAELSLITGTRARRLEGLQGCGLALSRALGG